MAKLIILCSGRPTINGSKRRSFLWSEKFKAYVHENRVLDEKEFNAVVEEVFKKNSDLRPCVRVVEYSDGAAATPDSSVVSAADHEALRAKYKALQDRIANSSGPIITVEAALEVIQREAPDRLRKQSLGRVAAPKQMSVS